MGSCRQDLLDHVIVLNEPHLKHLMVKYVRYYARTALTWDSRRTRPSVDLSRFVHQTLVSIPSPLGGAPSLRGRSIGELENSSGARESAWSFCLISRHEGLPSVHSLVREGHLSFPELPITTREGAEPTSGDATRQVLMNDKGEDGTEFSPFPLSWAWLERTCQPGPRHSPCQCYLCFRNCPRVSSASPAAAATKSHPQAPAVPRIVPRSSNPDRDCAHRSYKEK